MFHLTEAKETLQHALPINEVYRDLIKTHLKANLAWVLEQQKAIGTIGGHHRWSRRIYADFIGPEQFLRHAEA